MNSDRIKKIFLSLPFVLIAAAVGVLVGRLTVGGGGEPHAHEDGAPTASAQEEVWTCSMHPQVRQPAPGKCPICAMDLIPLSGEDDDDGDIPRLVVGARARALMEVETHPVLRGPVDHPVRLFGKVEYAETGLHDLALRTDGEIVRLHVDYVNAKVSRGQRIAEVYSPAVLAASEELLVAAGADRGRIIAMARRKLTLLGVTDARIDRSLSTGEPIETFPVHSPADGVLGSLQVRRGDWATRGSPIMRIADLSTVWVVLQANEADLHWIADGQEVEMTVSALPAQRIRGTVTFVDPVVGGASRTAGVRVPVENLEGQLKPGMLVTGVIRASLSSGGRLVAPSDAASANSVFDHPLLIPATAVLYTGPRSLVYVRAKDEDRLVFEPREVLLGPRAGDRQVIAGGLEEGEQVVSRGAFKIDSELQIRGRASMMSMTPGGTETLIRLDVPSRFSTTVGELAAVYAGVGEALAADDAPAAREALSSVSPALERVEPVGLTPVAADAWAELRPRIRIAIEAMEASSREMDIGAMRVAFEPLSDSMDEAVSRFGYGAAEPVYRAHCPMAFDDRGAGWLQTESRLANPYFGAEMLRCGTIEALGPRVPSRGRAGGGGEQGAGHHQHHH